MPGAGVRRWGHQVSFFVMQAALLDLEAVIRAAGEICSASASHQPASRSS